MKEQTIITDDRSFDIDVITKYLKRYVADIDWLEHIDRVYKRYLKAASSEDAQKQLRKTVACAMLIHLTDGTSIPDEPQKLLYWVPKWDQYDDRDWVSLFWKIYDEDQQIEQWRNRALSIGVVYPIEFSPITRQAFNWLYARAEENGCISEHNKSSIKKSCENLVIAYGGRVISNVFSKNSNIDKKVANWRTNYFFERLIYNTYDIDQILKIKKQELSRTNPKLVKKIKIDTGAKQ